MNRTGYWSRLRPSRRNMLGVLGAGAAGIAAAACGGGGSSTNGGSKSQPSGGGAAPKAAASVAPAGGAASNVQPRRGGTLTYVSAINPHLDIHQDQTGPQRISGLIYNRLLRYQDKAQIPEPDIATAMPEQPDQTTFIFKLRSGVKFHDKTPVNGRVMTAQDAAFSLERARTPDPNFVNAGDLANVDKIEATDDTTLRLTTRVSDAVLLTTLAYFPFIILAPETVAKFGDLKTGDAAIGTGPFVLKSFSSDTGGVLERHPNYWVPDQPYLDGVKQLVLSAAETWSQFLAGNLGDTGITADQVTGFASYDAFLKSNKLNAYTFDVVDTGSAQAHFMNSADPMFKDLRVRQAMNLIVDRQPQLTYGWPIGGLRSIALSYGKLQAGFGLPDAEYDKLPGFRTTKADRDKDIADGLALLKAAGYTKDTPAKWQITGWSLPQRSIGIDELQLAADMYKKVSGGALQPTVNGMEWGAWKQAEHDYKFQMISSAYSMGPDAHDALTKMYSSTGGRNFAQYKDPTFDAMLAKERGLFNIDERKKAVQDMLRYLNDQARVANVWTGTGPAPSVSLTTLQGRPPLFDYGKVGRMFFAS